MTRRKTKGELGGRPSREEETLKNHRGKDLREGQGRREVKTMHGSRCLAGHEVDEPRDSFAKGIRGAGDRQSPCFGYQWSRARDLARSTQKHRVECKNRSHPKRHREKKKITF